MRAAQHVLMVIFGAGASYDSDPRHPPGTWVREIEGGTESSPDPFQRLRLPLAKDLFGERFNEQLLKEVRSGPSRGLMPYLRAAACGPNAPVEQEIERFAEKEAAHPETRRQLLSLRYYIRDVIRDTGGIWIKNSGGITNYVVLLQELREWSNDHGVPLVLVTFNYDTLLDEACKDVLNMDVTAIDHYASNPQRMLIKLHGSVDWFHEACRVGMGFRDLAPQSAWSGSSIIVDDVYELQWSDKYIRGEPPNVARADSTYFPAIAVPTVTKFAFECPPSHLQALRTAIPQVTCLLVIGWRGMEKHFHNLWQEHRPKLTGGGLRALDRLHIVDRTVEEAKAVEERLREGAGIFAKEVGYTTSFFGFVDLNSNIRQLREFLNGSARE